MDWIGTYRRTDGLTLTLEKLHFNRRLKNREMEREKEGYKERMREKERISKG